MLSIKELLAHLIRRREWYLTYALASGETREARRWSLAVALASAEGMAIAAREQRSNGKSSSRGSRVRWKKRKTGCPGGRAS